MTPEDPEYPFQLACMQLRAAAEMARRTLQQIDAPAPARTVAAALCWLALDWPPDECVPDK